MLRLSLLLSLCFLLACQTQPSENSKTTDTSADVPIALTLQGAWQMEDPEQEIVTIFSDMNYASTVYDLETKAFISTTAGTYHSEGEKVIFDLDCSYPDTSLVGTQYVFLMTIDGSSAISTNQSNNKVSKWNQLDKGESPMAAAWRITGRERNGELSRNYERRARRTIKILSDTRFQWTAFNDETKAFSGSGGGTYTTVDGKYVETIEYFSRDSARVGAVLDFDYELIEGEWHHSGLSSKGKSIYEIWSDEDIYLSNLEKQTK